ncbi:RHS repeat-associated core domain containing protein [Nitzschia inconspicua]|uniref:RHS repeat-associated core domain containing protein n=1 Tax=Nitzschia inconspicua TaxID=303405 RepID=A0A9K3KFA7_9STRA|nr:RHS repeat-associated core domain containing protein [Nitzschia inconspicua]KAG7371679.1 RHS repeat-associated core domain containing protein [Nitzschia inconspicua]
MNIGNSFLYFYVTCVVLVTARQRSNRSTLGHGRRNVEPQNTSSLQPAATPENRMAEFNPVKKKDKKSKEDDPGLVVEENRCLDVAFRESAMVDILRLTPLRPDGKMDQKQQESQVGRPWQASISDLKRPRASFNARTTTSPQSKAWNWLLDMDSIMRAGGLCEDELQVKQRYALAVLYFSTRGDDFWISNGHWLSTQVEVCDWYGIVCKVESREITEIDLSSNGLIGTIPTELSLLSSLQELRLSQNALSGTIPSLALTQLKSFDVEENFLAGVALPNMVGLTQLENYQVSYNLLTMKGSQSNMLPSSLRRLWMSGNDLTGSLDAIVTIASPATTSLQEISLDHNGLVGTIPWVLTNFDSLRVLELQYNHLNGTIPSVGPGQWSLLEVLRLDHNAILTGTMPASICGLRRFDNKFPSALETLTVDCTTTNVTCACCTECF